MQPTPKTCNCQSGWKCPACAAKLESEVESWKILAHKSRERAEAAESTLRAVGELPGKWRSRAVDHYGQWAKAADQLEALLR